MTSLTYSETMKGYVSFGEPDYLQGYWKGRRDGIDLSFRLDVSIDDVDAFIDDEQHTASGTGTLRCPQLGGEMKIVKGTFNLFVPAGERRARMRYRLFVVDGDDRPITLSGFKVVSDDDGFDLYSDTTTLRTRLLAGHVEEEDERGDDDRRLASGILTIGAAGITRMVASARPRGPRRARALRRFMALFLGELSRVYRGPDRHDPEANFPHPVPAEGYGPAGYASGEWRDLHRGLRRRIVAFEAGDGYPCNLHNIRGPQEPTLGPVLVNAGTGVRANIFYGAPLPTSIVDVLVAEGYDVWIENWRASIDFPPNRYTLDDAAMFDHPAAVRTILRETGADRLKALVHCQGSTGFFMALTAGLLPEVTTVVSNAVSLHPVVERRARVKLRLLRPVTGLITPFLDPQWAVRAPSPKVWVLAAWVKLVRRECANPVCRFTSYMYGVGPDILWSHQQLTPPTHDWVGREFSWVPMTFFRQIWRSVKAGHLIPVKGLPGLPESFVAQPPDTKAKITFMAGTANRCFAPESQQRSYEYFSAHAPPGWHEHVPLEGYGHLDVFYGAHAATETYPKILAGLSR